MSLGDFLNTLYVKIRPVLLSLNKANNLQINKQLQNNLIKNIIIQRDYLSLPAAEELITLCQGQGIKIFYDLDDDLFSIDNNHPEYRKYKAKNTIISFLSQHSDVITVSTETLAQYFKGNKKVYVVKNALDERLWFSLN